MYNVFQPDEIIHYHMGTVSHKEISRVYNYRIMKLTSVYIAMLLLSNGDLWNLNLGTIEEEKKKS